MPVSQSSPVVLIITALAVTTVLATSACSVGRMPASPPSSAGMGDFMSQYAAAQEAAIRSGDEKLDCDALQTQLTATAQDPAVTQYVQSSGAMAQQDAAAMQGASQQVATQTALTVISSLGNAGAMAGMTGMAMQHQSQQADAMQHMQQRAARMQQMMAIMPQMLRGQRLIELAQERKCSWAP